MRHADRVGLTPVEPELDFGRVMAHVHAAIATIAPEDSPARLRARGVHVLQGDGRLLDCRTLAVDGRELRFRAAIVATGSEPVIPPIDGLHGDDVLTTDTVWALRELPARLV